MDMIKAFTKRAVVAALSILWLAGAAAAEPMDLRSAKQVLASSICSEIAHWARKHELPEEFFTRLIWKESRFNPRAVSPKGAKGIAQFMPGTAKQRGLADPFNAPAAIEASALYLKELRATFGNIGLAAAAYNAGEGRAQRFKDGETGLPGETRDYVLSITGRSHVDWLKPGTSDTVKQKKGAATSCGKFAASRVAAAGKPSKVPRGKSKEWGVVLAGGFSEENAMKSYKRIRVRFDVLQKEQPVVMRKKNLSRGRKAIVQVAVARESRGAAQKLCRELSKKGASCVVAKN